MTDSHRSVRILSVLASTLVALSCGLGYAFSAWGPQFSDHLSLTASQGEQVGNAANLGMYAIGIPAGSFIDRRGSRLAAMIGALCIGSGYFVLYIAHSRGSGTEAGLESESATRVNSIPFAAIWIASFVSGCDSFLAFNAAVKACLLNWPSHRGSATAVPVAAFGLSALTYCALSNAVAPNSTESFLFLASVVPLVTILFGAQFLRIVPTIQAYEIVAASEGEHVRAGARKNSAQLAQRHEEIDITGWNLVRSVIFYKLFLLAFLLAGVGLMTINNIGNIVRALWFLHDGHILERFVQKRQLLHVSIISLASCTGRLISGIGSDILVSRLHASRLWTLVASSILFIIAQFLALNISDPHSLTWLSSLTGTAYGILFGVLPAIVGDAFGTKGMGLNWGMFMLAPTLSGLVYNSVFGSILDRRGKIREDGQIEVVRNVHCTIGKRCYEPAYMVTLASSVFGFFWALYCIYSARKRKTDQDDDD